RCFLGSPLLLDQRAAPCEVVLETDEPLIVGTLIRVRAHLQTLIGEAQLLLDPLTLEREPRLTRLVGLLNVIAAARIGIFNLRRLHFRKLSAQRELLP